LIFLLLQTLLFSSSTFEAGIPWSGMERKFAYLKIFLKLIMSANFVFDKAGTAKGYMNLVCFGIALFIVTRRL
jgi:hypothetical protein